MKSVGEIASWSKCAGIRTVSISVLASFSSNFLSIGLSDLLDLDENQKLDSSESFCYKDFDRFARFAEYVAT